MFQVYLVDDDSLTLDDLARREIWQECGFAVAGKSCSPSTALEEIVGLHPDVVISDLKMPGMDGVGLMTQLKSRGASCEFIMLSAFASFADSRDFFVQNGFDYLLKPVDEMELQITLERLARRLFQRGGDTTEELPREGKDTIDDIMAYVRRNYKKKLTLSMLGDTFHLSPNYICNLFAKYWGQTFTAVVTSLRMSEAARLVQTTAKPLKEISAECGYANYFYFCRVFKEFHGCPPGDYACRFRAPKAR